MKEVEFLTEKDMPYFRKKAEEGEVMILEIPPKELLGINVTELLQRETAGEVIDTTELKEWIGQNRPFLQEQYEKGVKEATQRDQKNIASFDGAALIERLSEVELSEEKRDVIEKAILKRLPEEIILFLLSDHFLDDTVSADEMLSMVNSFA